MSDDNENVIREQRKRDFEALLEEKKAEHGHNKVIGWLDDEFGPLIFKRPGRPSMKRFLREVTSDDSDMLSAADNLALDSNLVPGREKLAHILDELPALSVTVSKELQALATTGATPQGKR